MSTEKSHVHTLGNLCSSLCAYHLPILRGSLLSGIFTLRIVTFRGYIRFVNYVKMREEDRQRQNSARCYIKSR